MAISPTCCCSKNLFRKRICGTVTRDDPSQVKNEAIRQPKQPNNESENRTYNITNLTNLSRRYPITLEDSKAIREQLDSNKILNH